MKAVFALFLGLIVGGTAVWFYTTNRNDRLVRTAEDKVAGAAQSVRTTASNELRVLHLRSEDLKEDLARGGQAVRQKAIEAGKVIADATADARATAAIKAKLLGSRELSALNISVNTTAGVVTLSGTVTSPESVSKAMLLAMDTEGVREVISTLQVRAKH